MKILTRFFDRFVQNRFFGSDFPTLRVMSCSQRYATGSGFSSLTPRRAGRMQLHPDAESSLLVLLAADECWRPSAAAVPQNVYLGIIVPVQ